MNTNLVRCRLVNADVLLPHSGCCCKGPQQCFFICTLALPVFAFFIHSGCSFRSVQNMLAARRVMFGQRLERRTRPTMTHCVFELLFLSKEVWREGEQMGIDNLFGSLATVPIPQYIAPSVCAEACVCTDGWAMRFKAIILHCTMTSYVIDLSQASSSVSPYSSSRILPLSTIPPTCMALISTVQ